MLASRRALATAAQASVVSPSLSSIEEKVSKLPTGLTVASVDLQGAVSQLVLAFRAGTKYEKEGEKGLVHHLRNCIGIDSANYLGVKMLWQTGSIGSNMKAIASKDMFAVHMSVVRTLSNVGLSLLGELAQPAFKVWDVVDAMDTMAIDLERQSPFDLAVENLYALAYRLNPLANPLLAPAHRIGKITSEQLVEFAQARLVAPEAVLVGVNVDHEMLVRYALEQGSIAEIGSGAGGKISESPYHGGGDTRVETATPLAHVIVAGKGGKLSDIKSVATQSVLSELIGGGHNVKFSSGPTVGIVAKQVFKSSGSASVQAFSTAHSDAGLTGAYIVADGGEVNACVKAAVAGMRQLADKGADAEGLAIAKKAAEVGVYRGAQVSAELALDKASQMITNGSSVSPAEFVNTISEVSAEDVKKAAAQMLSSKLNVSAYGNVRHVPFADEL